MSFYIRGYFDILLFKIKRISCICSHSSHRFGMVKVKVSHSFFVSEAAVLGSLYFGHNIWKTLSILLTSLPYSPLLRNRYPFTSGLRELSSPGLSGPYLNFRPSGDILHDNPVVDPNIELLFAGVLQQRLIYSFTMIYVVVLIMIISSYLMAEYLHVYERKARYWLLFLL